MELYNAEDYHALATQIIHIRRSDCWFGLFIGFLGNRNNLEYQ